jgi:hypothetical protein
MDITIQDRKMTHVVKSKNADIWFWSGAYGAKQYTVCLARSRNSWGVTINNSDVWESEIYGDDKKFCDSNYFNNLLYILIAKHWGASHIALHSQFDGRYSYLFPRISNPLGYFCVDEDLEPMKVIALTEEFEDKSGWRIVLHSQNQSGYWDDTYYVSDFFYGAFPENWRKVVKESGIVLHDASKCNGDE